jgi:uncharacterized membrane protein
MNMMLLHTKFGLAGSLFEVEIAVLVEAMVLLVIIAFLLAMAVMAVQRIRQKNQENDGTSRHALVSLRPSA